MKAAVTTYHRADTLDDAIVLMTELGGLAKFLAGGQSLMPMMNLRLAMPEAVLDISRIGALREAWKVDGQLFIGAGVTHAMIEDGKIADPAQGYLQHVAAGIAYRSIRNKGTVGGSLVHADPAADWSSALLALNAVAVLRGPDGERRIPLAQFQTGLMETCIGPTEILHGVLVPLLSPRARWSYMKFCRKVGELAHSIGAVVLDPAHGLANAVLGVAADKPFVLPRVSQQLGQGLPLYEVKQEAFRLLVEQDLAELADHDPSSYEFHLHKTMITRAVTEALKK